MPFKANPPRRHHIPRQRHRVRKPGDQFIYSDLAITMAPTLRAAFPPPLRQTEGLIGSTVQLVGLAVPDHCTISWRAKTVRPPTTVTSSDGAVELLIDSTSVKLCGPGEWLAKKHGIQSRRAWKKLRVGLGAFIGRIVAATRQWHNHHRRREWGGVVAPTLCGLRFQVSDVRLLVVGDGLEVTRLSDELDSQDDR